MRPLNTSDEANVSDLAARQLAAYNDADLDAFCACYHDEVKVLDADGQITAEGIDAFRSRYAPMFARGGFGASVPQRVSVGDHCVDVEDYWRTDPETGARTEGRVMVRYSLRGDRIGVVQFFRG
ncbi:MAG: nuclear transport factor 2 family protein [Myxococcota bacterium]